MRVGLTHIAEDGAVDGLEVTFGSDPLDPLSVPTARVPTLPWPGLVLLAAALVAGFGVADRYAARRKREGSAE